MRGNLLAVGIVLGAIGASLWYLPLEAGTISPTTVTNGMKEVVELAAPLDVLGANSPFTLSWTASSNVTVSVYDCKGDSTCALSGTGTPTARASGTSGSLSWSGHRGQYFAIVPTGGSATIVVNYNDPILGGLLGLGVFVFGVILFLFGVGLSRRSTPVSVVPAHFRTTATTAQDGVLEEKPPTREV